uniref:AVL9/DENND6 domain-containing protein n=2 Tax=Tetranychus urticae TaxID=32264 RepID=T1L565_TETUR
MKELENCDHNGPILYVLVVGFHHKKGCLIEYCFPKMRHTEDSDGKESDMDGNDDSTTNENDNKKPFKLPKVWRTLPSIALPDGAHNYDRDTIYFHLPHPDRPLSTIYGISCYRQIASDRLHRKTDD